MKALLQLALCTVFGVAFFLAGVALGRQDQRQGQELPPVTLQPITRSVLLVRGGLGANSGLIVGKGEVIAVDAKMNPDSIQEMLVELKKLMPFPVTKIILTHSDADHINGLPGFPRGLQIISQEQVKADMIKAAADLPALANCLPTTVFKDEMTIKTGRATITIAHYGPAHTNGDAVVYIDGENVAFVGDLVFIGRDPIINRAKNGSSFGLVKTLRAILGHRPHVENFIPGHGDMIMRIEMENLVRSIEIKQAKIKTFIAEGKSLDEIKKILHVDERPGAAGRAKFPSLVEVIYQELTEAKK